ncbi:MAG: hypothetical protein IJX76_10210 [Clostridia bacterium]|nr:hypothetical protein [Clostridia bacterium]
MNTRSDLTLRLTLTLLAVLLLLVACSGLLALADAEEPPLAADMTQAEATTTAEAESVAETVGETSAEPTVPEDGTVTDLPTETTADPDGSMPTPSDTTALPDSSSGVVDGSSYAPNLSGSTPVEGSGDLSSWLPATTIVPIITTPQVTTTKITTTKAPVVTDPPTYSTMPITLTGALQSAPADPLSTDASTTTAVTTYPVGTPPAVIGTTGPQSPSSSGNILGGDTDNTDPAGTDAPDPGESDQTDPARGEMLNTLIVTFAVIAVLASGAVIVLKFIHV